MNCVGIPRWLLVGCFWMIMPAIAYGAGEQGGRMPSGNAGNSPGSPPFSGSSNLRNDGQQIPIYKPPLLGAPKGRVSGGSRGIEDESPRVLLLAPDHTGLTVQEQPTLYWFLSNPSKYPIEFTIIESATTRPVLTFMIKPPVHAGVRSLRLSDHGVRLKKGIRYQCFLAMVPDAYKRSKDIISGGEIERIEFSDALRLKLKRAGKAGAPSIYAEEGIWYDALSSISTLIDGSPRQPFLRRQRASLLDQIGIKEAAEYEMEKAASEGQ